MIGAWSILFEPLLPWLAIAASGAGLAAAVIYAYLAGSRRGLLSRSAAGALLLLYLCGPQLAEQKARVFAVHPFAGSG